MLYCIVKQKVINISALIEKCSEKTHKGGSWRRELSGLGALVHLNTKGCMCGHCLGKRQTESAAK